MVEDAHKVRLLADGRVDLARKVILVATGAAPVLGPDVPGREHAITSNEIFDLPQLPKRILIVGGGYIAVEFAAIVRAASAREVTIAHARREHPARLRRRSARGVRDALNRSRRSSLNSSMLPMRIEKKAEAISVTLAKGETLDVDQVMIATGRRPNTRGLGLEKLGVAS